MGLVHSQIQAGYETTVIMPLQGTPQNWDSIAKNIADQFWLQQFIYEVIFVSFQVVFSHKIHCRDFLVSYIIHNVIMLEECNKLIGAMVCLGR